MDNESKILSVSEAARIGWGEVVPPAELHIMSQQPATDPATQNVMNLYAGEAVPPQEMRSSEALIDTSKLSPETLAALRQADEVAGTWQLEPKSRKIYFETVVEVGKGRDRTKESDAEKLRILHQVVPQAQFEMDAAEAAVQTQRAVVAEANETYQDHADHVAGLDHDLEATHVLIRTEGAKRDELKQARAIYVARYREIDLGKKADGSDAEPLNEAERQQLIVEGLEYGPLKTTEAMDNYIAGSPQEKERSLAVMEHIISLYDAQIKAINALITEYGLELQAISNERRAAVMEKDVAHHKLIAASRVLDTLEAEHHTREGVYKDALNLNRRIIGQPEEEFGDEVNRRFQEKKAERALAESPQPLQEIVFGGAGALSVADRRDGREPLAIEGSRVRGIFASSVISRGLGKKVITSVGLPQPKHRKN